MPQPLRPRRFLQLTEDNLEYLALLATGACISGPIGLKPLQRQCWKATTPPKALQRQKNETHLQAWENQLLHLIQRNKQIKSGKMKRQRKTKKINELKISNLSDQQFKGTVIKMLTKLGRTMEKHSEVLTETGKKKSKRSYKAE